MNERDRLPSPDVTEHGRLTETVSRLTHDLASPLMIVITLSELLLEDASLSDQQRRDMHQIFTAAQEAAAIVRGIRTLAHEVRPSDA